LNYWLTNSQRIDRPDIANAGKQSRHVHNLISLDCLKLETTHGT
jgi:hypothetical protein